MVYAVCLEPSWFGGWGTSSGLRTRPFRFCSLLGAAMAINLSPGFYRFRGEWPWQIYLPYDSIPTASTTSLKHAFNIPFRDA